MDRRAFLQTATLAGAAAAAPASAQHEGGQKGHAAGQGTIMRIGFAGY